MHTDTENAMQHVMQQPDIAPALHVFDAAKSVGHFSNWEVSNLKMQKILYIAQMFHMGRNNGARLIESSFQAWVYCPVIPKLYRKLRVFGTNGAEDVFQRHNIVEDAKQRELLKELTIFLKDQTASWLIVLTHRQGGAWDINYNPERENTLIPDAAIKEEYHKFYTGNSPNGA